MQSVLQIPNKYGWTSDLKQKRLFGRDLTEHIWCTCQLKEALTGAVDAQNLFLFWIKWLHISTWKSLFKERKAATFSPEEYLVKQKDI